MSIRAGVGFANFPFETADAYLAYARTCDEIGLDSIWQTDRLQSEEPFLEAMSALAVVAGATRRIKFGMNAIVVGFRDPLVLAKQCATLDFLSGGRLLPVFGIGAPASPEWKATGRSTKNRGKAANEALEIMARLWSEESVTFEGEFYQYHHATISPRPVQSPLPLWIGGSSPAAQRRTAALGTGWIGGLNTPEEVGETIRGIQAELEKTGRHIDPDHFGASIPFHIGDAGEVDIESQYLGQAARNAGLKLEDVFAVGSADKIAARLNQYVAQGASKIVLFPAVEDESSIMDQTRQLVEDVLPQVEDR
ncbi:MAG: TIGR03619 family F420-dependent LLM class oxidoreductase [Myxococcales bacterium]|nr:TIGR03619 family F420-dependent LLM class oxidoreductase [Myxococcales bacterium]